jgi:acetolactate synthase regulatory subunit
MPLKVDSVTKDGTVIHRFAGSAIRDDGEALQVARGSNRAGLEAVLRMAVHRYGQNIAVNGSDEFKEKIARVAATSNSTSPSMTLRWKRGAKSWCV